MHDKNGNSNYNTITGFHITFRMVPDQQTNTELAQWEQLDDITDVTQAARELDRIFGSV